MLLVLFVLVVFTQMLLDLLTASLRRVTKDEYRTAIDRVPRRWEKCVDSAGAYLE